MISDADRLAAEQASERELEDLIRQYKEARTAETRSAWHRLALGYQSHPTAEPEPSTRAVRA